MEEVEKHIKILLENKTPKDFKGDEFKKLEYYLDTKDIANKFLEAAIFNKTFKGELIINSNGHIFDDSIGYKIGNLLKNNNLKSLTIKNKDSPFSDRVTSYIGDIIYNNCSNLETLEVYLNVGELSYTHIFQFLLKKDHKLISIKYLKISEEFIKKVKEFSNHINPDSPIKTIEFYYEPFTELNLLYKSNSSKGLIQQEIYEQFSDVIQLLPNLTSVKVRPLYSLIARKDKIEFTKNSEYSIPSFVDTELTYENFESFNLELYEDIEKINTTFEFACSLNIEKSLKHSTNIEETFNLENIKMSKIM